MNSARTHKTLVEEEPLQRVEGRRTHHRERAGPPYRTSRKGHARVWKTGKLHPDIPRVRHDLDALAMPQTAGHLRGGRTRRKRNRIALIDHLCRREGDAPFLIRKALFAQRKGRIKSERLVGHLPRPLPAALPAVYQTALRELNHAPPDARRRSIEGERQAHKPTLVPFQH